MLAPVLEDHHLRRLLEAGRSLVARLDLDGVLDEVLAAARELTGARYAAVGVLDAESRELERFLVRGVDEATFRSIGELPRGRGVLGVLIDDPRPLRLHRVGEHPRSYGFPPAHPPMETFLGVPILIRREAWGNLYLTDKAGGEDFDAADEAATVVLADWAAMPSRTRGSTRRPPPAATPSSRPWSGSRRRPPSRGRWGRRPTSTGCSS